MSRDPIGERGGVNLHGFVGNDPVNFIDSDGRAPMSAGVGGPQFMPSGGFKPSPSYPGTNYSEGNIRELLSKVDSEGKIGPNCPECILKPIRELKKKLLLSALEWNKTSKQWEQHTEECTGNECYTQAQKLGEYLNTRQPSLKILPNTSIFVWFFYDLGGSKLPVLKGLASHNVTGVYMEDFTKRECGFSDFYIDPFKGQNGKNSEGKIGSGTIDDFKAFYPYDAGLWE